MGGSIFVPLQNAVTRNPDTFATEMAAARVAAKDSIRALVHRSKVIVFDAYGTLFDVQAAARGAGLGEAATRLFETVSRPPAASPTPKGTPRL